MNFCGDFNWFINFVQMDLLYSMASQRASWLFGLKMVLKCRALICLYCIRVSRQVNSYLHQYITGWVPGYFSQAYLRLLILNLSKLLGSYAPSVLQFCGFVPLHGSRMLFYEYLTNWTSYFRQIPKVQGPRACGVRSVLFWHYHWPCILCFSGIK